METNSGRTTLPPGANEIMKAIHAGQYENNGQKIQALSMLYAKHVRSGGKIKRSTDARSLCLFPSLAFSLSRARALVGGGMYLSWHACARAFVCVRVCVCVCVCTHTCVCVDTHAQQWQKAYHIDDEKRRC